MEESDLDMISELRSPKDGGYEIAFRAPDKGVKTGAGKDTEKDSPVVSCPHHVGYLKTRSKDEAVPDNCLTCPKILQCMV